MSSYYVLKIQYVNRPPETRNISAPATTIGRESGDIVLNDPQTSGRHAEIVFQTGQVRIRDAGSTNGTWFNGQRLTEFVLEPGQWFQVGQTTLQLMASHGEQQQAPAKTMMAIGAPPPGSGPGAPGSSPMGWGAPGSSPAANPSAFAPSPAPGQAGSPRPAAPGPGAPFHTPSGPGVPGPRPGFAGPSGPTAPGSGSPLAPPLGRGVPGPSFGEPPGIGGPGAQARQGSDFSGPSGGPPGPASRGPNFGGPPGGPPPGGPSSGGPPGGPPPGGPNFGGPPGGPPPAVPNFGGPPGGPPPGGPNFGGPPGGPSFGGPPGGPPPGGPNFGGPPGGPPPAVPNFGGPPGGPNFGGPPGGPNFGGPPGGPNFGGPPGGPAPGGPNFGGPPGGPAPGGPNFGGPPGAMARPGGPGPGGPMMPAPAMGMGPAPMAPAGPGMPLAQLGAGVRPHFRGTGGDLLVTMIVGSLLTLITFGIYFSWFLCRLLNYLTSNMTLGPTRRGELRLEFNGRGGELLVLMLVGGLLTSITFGVYFAWFQCKLVKYFTDNLVAVASDGTRQRLSFEGRGGELFVTLLVGGLLTSITFGIYMPWFICKLSKFYMSNTNVLENEQPQGRLDFVGHGGELFVTYLVGGLLTAITFGIYLSWFQVKLKRFVNTHTRIMFQGRLFVGDFHGTGGELFVTRLVGGILTLITFGIYFAWFQVKLWAFEYNNAEYREVSGGPPPMGGAFGPQGAAPMMR